MTVAALAVQTPDVVWWALIPVILLAASGLLILTVASLLTHLPRWVAPLWTVLAGVAVLIAVSYTHLTLPTNREV